MTTVKELALMPEFVVSGNAACAGCGLSMALRFALKALGPDTVMVVPACCTSVIQGPIPKSGVGVPIYNVAFGAASSTASGMVNAFRRKEKKTNVLVWAGDGGTTDIGLASLSGAAERGDDLIYVCYNNQVYGNTGSQRSSATPIGAKTSTTPRGHEGSGKFLPFIMMAHRIPYVATASSGYPRDLFDKVSKAKSIEGFRYIEIFSPCPPNWRAPKNKAVELGRLAVETGFWPMFEMENDKVTLSRRGQRFVDPDKRKSLGDFIALQGRFKGVDPGLIDGLQAQINERWDYLGRFLNQS